MSPVSLASPQPFPQSGRQHHLLGKNLPKLALPCTHTSCISICYRVNIPNDCGSSLADVHLFSLVSGSFLSAPNYHFPVLEQNPPPSTLIILQVTPFLSLLSKCLSFGHYSAHTTVFFPYFQRLKWPSLMGTSSPQLYKLSKWLHQDGLFWLSHSFILGKISHSPHNCGFLPTSSLNKQVFTSTHSLHCRVYRELEYAWPWASWWNI